MSKILVALCCVFFLTGLVSADLGYASATEKKESEPETFCPKTRISDNNMCLYCHTAPDFKLKEAKPDRALELPHNVSLIDGKLYYVIDTMYSEPISRIFEYMAWHPEFKHIIFEVHSPGGSLLEAWKIIGLMNMAKSRGVTVETRVYGFAASAGFLVFVNGEMGMRWASPTAELMHHELWSFKFFDLASPSKKEDEAIVFRHLQDTIHNWLLTRTTRPMTKEGLDEMVRHKDYWMNGQDAIDLGFADGVPH